MEMLDDLARRVEASTDLNEAQKQSARSSIEKGKAALQLNADFVASLKVWQQKTDSIEADRAKIQAKVDAQQHQPAEHANSYTPLPQLEQTLATKQQNLVQAETDLSQTEKRISDRGARQKAIKERLAAIPGQIDSNTAELSRPEPGVSDPLLIAARRLQIQAELTRLGNEPAALQAEATYWSAQDAANLIQLERQLASSTVARLKDEVSEWQREVLRARSSDARGRAELSREAAQAATVPEIREIYEQNAETVTNEIRAREKQKLIADQIAHTKSEQDLLKQMREELKQREANLGTSRAFGVRLHELRRLLPDLASLQQEIRTRIPVEQDAQLAFIETREERSRLDHLNSSVETLVRKILPHDANPVEREELAADARKAYEQRQKYLTDLVSANEAYVTSLDQLSFEQDQLVRQLNDFNNYINEKIIWVSTHRPLTVMDVLHVRNELRALFSTAEWTQLWDTFRRDARAQPFLYGLAGLVWVLLFITQSRQRASLKQSGQRASSRLNTDMTPTWTALLWTFVKSLITPLPFLFLGWRGQMAGEGSVLEFSQSVSTLSIWLWWLEAVRLTCRKNGLGAAHFHWPVRVTDQVTLQLAAFITTSTPLAFAAALLRSRSIEGDTDALQRCCGVAFFLLMAFTLWQLTSRKKGIFREWIEKYPNGWFDRLSVIWNSALVALPIFLAALLIAGYTFAVDRLSVHLAQTLMLAFGAIFGRSLLFRWLTLRQRRLAIAHAREVRAAIAESPKQEDGTHAAVLEAQEAQSNLTEVSAQSKRLLNTTLLMLSLIWGWYIWIDVLPALQKLDQTPVPILYISWRTLIVALLQVVLFTTAARNIPGLLEITLLERLPLDRSVRYAIGAMLRYTIVVIGVLVFVNSLGYTWDRLQWLVAALTFGLGFGMQDIFANFISGLIILFEQPIRVGDVVTLDNVTGTVNRIRIRSTTLIDSDRREYIVPNKELITGKLLNWTLTDTTNRITIQVGASYDADPQMIRSLLTDIVKTQPSIMAEPAPTITFNGFGDNSINFVIYAYLPSLDLRMETLHGLHSRIHKAFREANVEIPFPQLDMHLRSSVPLIYERVRPGTPLHPEHNGTPAGEKTPANESAPKTEDALP